MTEALIGDVAEVINGVTFASPEASSSALSGYIPILRAGNIKTELDIQNDLIWVPADKVSISQQLSRGDIAICMSSGSSKVVGKSAQLKNDFYGSVGAFCAILRAGSQLLDSYLSYWLKSELFLEWRDKQARGANIQNLRASQIRKIPIHIPDLNEQKRIAAILENADRLRRLRRYARKLSDAFLQTVFLEMFGDPVRNVKGYPWLRFGDVCDSRLGKMLDSKQQTGKHNRPYVRNVNIQWGKISLDDLQEMDFDEEDREKYQLLPGDVLICEGGEVGRAAIWKCQMEECYFQKALHRARPDLSKITSEYIVWLMFCLANLGGLVESTSQVTISHLTGIKLKAMNIPLPPISEQHNFANVVSKFEELQDQLSEAERQVEHLFQSLLHRAFRGEL
jgi:type I restriction enzyme S subunit